MERDLRPFVRPVSKGRFRTLLSGYSNFATLILSTAVMQQRASTWVDFISPYGYHSHFYVYNKVYAPIGMRSLLCMYSCFHTALSECTMPWCEYIIAGVGRLYVAYLYPEAMREPDLRDKHARDISPTSFLFPYVC